MASDEPDLSGLHQTEIDGLPAFFSAGTEERARLLGERVAAARSWLDDLLGVRPRVVLTAVAPADWSKVTDFPVYGFPHFVGDDTIAVGGEPAPVFDHIVGLTWDRLTPLLRHEMHRAYGEPPNVQSFADLLVVHELAHLYHHQSGFWFPQRWIAELFANVCLEGYVSEREPHLGDALHALPRCASAMDESVLVERDLNRMAESLEAGPAGPLNYAWYQMNLHQAAEQVWAAGGRPTLQRLFRRFRGDSSATEDLRAVLTADVHPILGTLIDDWPIQPSGDS